MNRKELIEAILKDKELSHLTKKDEDHFVATLLDVVKKTVKKGDDVSLIGFGSFTKVKRAARTGVNPATGEKIKIKARLYQNLSQVKLGKICSKNCYSNYV